MGMDVCGRKPTSDEGEYFRNNVWWWRPLADYCVRIAPDIAAQCKYWQSNDGDGLDERNSLALADLLQAEIDSGRCASFARVRESGLELLPNECCEACEGTGTRKPPPEYGAGDLLTGVKCNGCNGEGVREPWARAYQFDVENVRHFVGFLRCCGGFEIW